MRRAASRAASFTRFARSAPVIPGVADASCSRLTSARERNLSRVDLQDLHAALVVGRMDDDLPVEAPRSQQRGVEDVRPVGGGQDDDALVAGEAVHLGEDLIERLFALVMTAERPRAAASAADRVDLVDEDDRRRDLARLRKELADAAGADADDHLDELRRAGAEEGHLRLARGGAREQGLASPRRAGQQHALRRAGAETAILPRVFQEVDDLVDLRLHFVDARDIVERDADGFRDRRASAFRLPAVRQPWLPAGA